MKFYFISVVLNKKLAKIMRFLSRESEKRQKVLIKIANFIQFSRKF